MPSVSFSGVEFLGSIVVEPRKDGPKFVVSEAAKVVSTATAYAFSGSTDGTTLAIGAYSAYKVFLYTYNGTNWVLDTEITQATGRFGYKVAVDGNWLAVATTPASGNGQVNIYRRVDGVWQTTPTKIYTIPASATGSGFASSVALSGNTLVIGHRQSGTNPGGAHIFEFNGTEWASTGTFLTYEGTTRAGNNQNFGAEVSIDNDIVVIGGTGSTTTNGTGMAFLSKRTGGTWSSPIAIQPSTTFTDGFGYFVKVVGNKVLVGSPVGNATEKIPGRVFLYDYTDSSPVLEQIFTVKADASEIIQDTGVGTSDNFGWSADISSDGTRLLIGAIGRNSNRGAVYVYEKVGGEWSATPLPDGSKVLASDATSNMRFGSITLFVQGGFVVGAYGTKSYYWFK